MNETERRALAEFMFAALGDIKEEEGDAILSFETWWEEMNDYEYIGDDDTWMIPVYIFRKLVNGGADYITQRTPVAEDAVEAVADAIGKSMGASIAPDGFKVYVDWGVLVEAARAALEAAPVSDLDAMLAGEDPDVIIIDTTHIAPTEYRAHLYDRGSSWQLTGTGSTRNEAVANALKGGAS